MTRGLSTGGLSCRSGHRTENCCRTGASCNYNYSSMGLLNLPRDVLNFVFSQFCFVLDFQELLRLRLVCRDFQRISMSDVSKTWRRHFVSFELWYIRISCLEHRIVGCYDMDIFTRRCLLREDDNTWFSIGGMKLLFWGMERAAMMFLEGEKRYFFRLTGRTQFGAVTRHNRYSRKREGNQTEEPNDFSRNDFVFPTRRRGR